METERVILDRGFGPYFDEESKILLLGSFPSSLSRKEKFYYGNPTNRFWKVISQVYGEGCPSSVEEKKKLLTRHHLALYDVIERCSIVGASDSKIRDVEYTDLSLILKKAKIKKIVCVGKKAYQLFVKKYGEGKCLYLPSTSAANASYSLAKLVEEFKKILLA